MSEFTTSTERNGHRSLKVGVLTATCLLLTACLNGESQDNMGPSQSIEEAYNNAIAGIKKHEEQFSRDMCLRVYQTDNDCDGVLNSNDQFPNGPDLGDLDGDLIPNAIDLHPETSNASNGRQLDTDFDGLWDDLDSYSGNNFADDDRDGILNGHDKQPRLPAPRSTANAQDSRIINPNASNTDLGNIVVKARMGNQIFRDFLAKDPTTAQKVPHPLRADYDRDGYSDYYDTEPRNGYITPDNDIYNIGGDAWYEKQQEKKRESQPTRFGGKAIIDLDGKRSNIQLDDN